MVLGVQGLTGQAEGALTNKQRDMLWPDGEESYTPAGAMPVSFSGERQQDNTVINTEMRPLEDWLEHL